MMVRMIETQSDHANPDLAVIALDEFDAEASSRLHLRPVGLVTGSAAARAIAAGLALPLAGSATAFTLVEVLARTGDRIVAALAGLPALRNWAKEQGAAGRERVETQLFRLSDKRATWAGLSLDRPLVMGIVNVTPDSFFFGSGDDSEQAVALGRAMVAAGADIIDIGGESTRPGAGVVSPDEEIRRIEPVVRALANTGATISVDTRKAAVMEAAIGWGVRIINDVAALEGPGSLEAVAKSATVGVVLMHMRGEPGTMQRAPSYSLASLDIVEYLAARIAACEAAGIPPQRIVVDPGIGFGKTVEHNLEILARLTLLHTLRCGLLVGLSRKSTIGRVGGGVPVEARLPGSIAGALQALRQGTQILRVHDVAETRQAIALWQAIAQGA